MAVQIPLRRKYLQGRRFGYAGGENACPLKRRNKMSDVLKKRLPPQPLITLVVDGGTGRSRGFQPTGEFRSR